MKKGVSGHAYVTLVVYDAKKGNIIYFILKGNDTSNNF